jgi:hypothetical protein
MQISNTTPIAVLPLLFQLAGPVFFLRLSFISWNKRLVEVFECYQRSTKYHRITDNIILNTNIVIV